MKQLLLILTLIYGAQSFAQVDKKGKLYERLYYEEARYETNEYILLFTNIVATDAYVKYKLKIFSRISSAIPRPVSPMVSSM